MLLPGQLEELLEMWRPRMFTAAAGRFVAACRDQRNGCLHRTTGDKNSLNVLRASRTTSDHSPAARSDRRLRGQDSHVLLELEHPNRSTELKKKNRKQTVCSGTKRSGRNNVDALITTYGQQEQQRRDLRRLQHLLQQQHPGPEQLRPAAPTRRRSRPRTGGGSDRD